MSAEDAFNQVPSHITKFRVGDGMMWYQKDKRNELDFFIKNVKVDKYQHVHFWFNGDEHNAVITNENRRDMENEHIPFHTIQFLQTIGEPLGALFGSMQHLSPTDDRFTGRVVVLSPLPKIVYRKVKRDNAYFSIEANYSEYLFENVDASIPQFGVMIEEPDILTDFVLVGKGEIHAMSMDVLNRCAEKVAQGFRVMGFKVLDE